MAAFHDWSWGTEVLLEQRRQLNGSYHIYMHEDLLQAIFLQYIGVRWSVFWKKTFTSFRMSPSVSKQPQASVDPLDRKRRDYYLGARSHYLTVDRVRWEKYRKGYFLTQLLDSFSQDTSAEEGEEEANFEESAMQRNLLQVQQGSVQPQQMQQAQQSAGRFKQKAMQPARQSTGTKKPRKQLASRAAVYDVEAEVDDDDEGGDDTGKPRNAMEAKQVWSRRFNIPVNSYASNTIPALFMNYDICMESALLQVDTFSQYRTTLLSIRLE